MLEDHIVIDPDQKRITCWRETVQVCNDASKVLNHLLWLRRSSGLPNDHVVGSWNPAPSESVNVSFRKVLYCEIAHNWDSN